MVPISDLRKYVTPEVSGCPVPMIDMAILSATIELCKRVPLLRDTYGPVDLTAGDNTITHPDGYRIDRFMQVWLDGIEIDTKSVDDFIGSGDWMNQTGSPTMLLVDRNSVRPYPLDTGSLTAQVVLVPSRSATEVDDLIFEDYVETVAHGALYRLQAPAPGEAVPWGNPSMSEYHRQMFEQGVGAAKIQPYSSAPMRVKTLDL